jgi:MFS family permease
VRSSEKIRILAANFIIPFIMSAFAVMLPLYLLELNISLIEIGILFSLMPLVFLIFRMLFASFADAQGTGRIVLLYAGSAILTPAVSAIATTSIVFSGAKFFEGLLHSGIWSVNRTEIIQSYGKRQAERQLALHQGVRYFADAAGRLGAGLLILYLGFQYSFLALSAVGVIFLVIALLSLGKSLKPLKEDKGFIKRIFEPKSGRFWRLSFHLLFLALAADMLFMFIIPVFAATELLLGPAEVGAVLAILSLGAGAASLALVQHNIGKSVLFALTFLGMALPIMLLPFSGSGILFWLSILVLSIGLGSSFVLYEEILGHAMKNHKNISTDIGLVHIPLRAGEFLFLASAGFMVSFLGWAPLFFLCSLLVIAFVVFARNDL